MSYRASIVKSVQYGTVTITNTNAAATAAITAVTTAASVVVPLQGVSTNGAASAALLSDLATLVLTNATTVTATRADSTGNTGTIGFVVLEFYPQVIRSIQSGTIQMNAGAASNTGAITAVVTGKTWLVHQGETISSSAGDMQCNFSRVVLTNTTTVTASREDGTTGISVTAFTAVEFR